MIILMWGFHVCVCVCMCVCMCVCVCVYVCVFIILQSVKHNGSGLLITSDRDRPSSGTLHKNTFYHENKVYKSYIF